MAMIILCIVNPKKVFFKKKEDYIMPFLGLCTEELAFILFLILILLILGFD